MTIDPEMGMFLELTRTSPKFLEKLMEKEVPEIGDASVTIMAASRIPGQRAKLALKTDFPNIDPIELGFLFVVLYGLGHISLGIDCKTY